MLRIVACSGFDDSLRPAALDPHYAVAYPLHADARTALVVLGSVFLALTGGEALYADVGHFGRRAI